MPSVEVEGLTIAFERRGSGPPVVLLHGGVSDHREWRPQIDGLHDGFDVIAWDAPGCGASSDPPVSFRMPEYADVLAGFLRALGLERAHVVGLSWGSSLAMELAHRHPRALRSLVLVSAYAGWAGSLSAEAVAGRVRDAERAFDLPPEDLARSWIPTLFTHRATPEMIADTVAVVASARRSGALPMLYAMAEADLRQALPAIAVPTLLLVGEEDVRAPLAVARDLQAQIPGAELVVVPEAGHQCNIEAPDRVNQALRAFLEAH